MAIAACSDGKAAVSDFAQRHARTNLLGRKAIDLRVTAIAEDQSLLGVEEANALRNIVDRCFIAQGLRL